ncbi:MAG: 5-formyltetrahydrofolate cyclo-ligase [Lachnospiraceae bacterium]|nr:5-formyltetrahydrofolate cyclo-ligase [Lachnospiraceae bacterium]
MNRTGVRTDAAFAVSDEIPEAPEADQKRKRADAATEKEQKTEKKRVRLAALAKRDSLSAEQRRDYSGRIVQNLTGLPCYREADAVLVYISFRSEADTFPFMERAFADGKAVFAPKVLGKEMDFYRISSRNDLSAEYRGILEPAGGQSFDEWADDCISQCRKRPHGKRMTDMEEKGAVPSVLICMPGAAFDRARHRIGYGGGFYDRYLNRFAENGSETDAAAYLRIKLTTVALAFSCQLFDTIPWEAHDIRPARIITETEII